MMKAFSLVEILLVVAIIGMLTMASIAMYQSYIIRAQVISGITILHMQQLEIAKYADINGVLPSSEEVGDVVAPPFISTTTVETNAPTDADIIKVEVNFSNSAKKEISNKSIILEGKLNKNGTWTWLCRDSTDSNAINAKYLPSQCQYTGNSCPASFCLADE